MAPALLSGLAALALQAAGDPPAGDPHLVVDQFGYLPGARKIAVLRQPQLGWDAPDDFVPGPDLEVRRAGDGELVLAGAPLPWNEGQLHSQSGDRVWWFDFTSLTRTGSYYVLDLSSGARSEDFDIGADVYRPIVREALRSFYYQRCGTPKQTPFAGPDWTDTACHLGPLQDTDCRSILDPTAQSARDLSGGWHDAGDYNKYVNFVDGALHDLLSAFEDHPALFGDDHGLPESGNGLPDLLDALRRELEWMLSMQESDGAVLHKVSTTCFCGSSPPSADALERYYAPPTASATISAAGAWAHAAQVFRPHVPDFAATLKAAALQAWGWLESNPGALPSHYDNAGFSTADAEDSDYWQMANRVNAAVYLFRLTGQSAFREHVDQALPSIHLIQWQAAIPWEWESHDALLTYADLPGATPATAQAIRDAYAHSLSGNHLGHFLAQTDAYRAYMKDGDYVWGSHRAKAHLGLQYAAMAHHGLDLPALEDYRAATEGFVNYFHGVNPGGHAFLTNMGSFGAGKSLRETYHGWFEHESIWDSTATGPGPPPGIFPVGVNPNYSPGGEYSGPPLAPPLDQPILKSYRDWNTGWPENSWEVTESGLRTRAAHVRLLAELADGPVGFSNLGFELAGGAGAPSLSASGSGHAGLPLQLSLQGAAPDAPALLVLGASTLELPLLGGVLVPYPNLTVPLGTDAQGSAGLTHTFQAKLAPGTHIWLQCWVLDPSAPASVSASNALLYSAP